MATRPSRVGTYQWHEARLPQACAPNQAQRLEQRQAHDAASRVNPSQTQPTMMIQK
jgi:hypothetical protein